MQGHLFFPLNPVLNQVYTYEGNTWVYNGTNWNITSIKGETGPSTDDIEVTRLLASTTLKSGLASSSEFISYYPKKMRGVVTVSSIGIADGFISNNGCDFGPDTEGTTTCGIQEAINSLVPSIGRNYSTTTSIASVSGVVLLSAGVFRTTRPIIIPAYSRITIQGVGRSTWSSIKTVSPYEYSGGSIIVGNCISAQGIHMGVLHCMTADPQPVTVVTTTQSVADVSTWDGQAGDSLTLSSTIAYSGWVSIPLTNGGTVIAAVGSGAATTATYMKVMAVYNPDGTYGTTGAIANGAVVTRYAVAQYQDFDAGYHGGGYCLSHVNLRDFDVRSISPAAPQTGLDSAKGYFLPSILDISGIDIGEVANITVTEVNPAGNIRAYIGSACVNYNGGANGDMKNLRNIDVGGCHYGFILRSSHMSADALTAAGQNYDTNSVGFNIGGNLGNVFRNFQVHSSNNGLKFDNYGYGLPTTVIDGFHFENCTHYIYMASNTKGTLIIRNPAWNSAADPQTDIASLTQNTVVVTVDENGDGGAQTKHYRPAAYNFTAGGAGPGWWPSGVGTTSPLVIPALPVDQTWKLSTPNGITQLSVNGEALFPVSPTNAAVVHVKAGNTLTITWSTTAPVFRVIPQ